MSNLRSIVDRPHRRNTFSYKTIDKPIRDILNERGTAGNTVQVAMPFVKVTTTLDLGAINIADQGKGFTLGLHAIEEDIAMQDIFSNSNGQSFVGYTYVKDANGTVLNRKVYVDETLLDPRLSTLINVGGQIVTGANIPQRQPPPGITNVKVGRYRNGLLASGEFDIEIPTLAQLEMLHRTFLVPGCGVILEWGQQFAPKLRESYGERGLSDSNIRDYMFPWYNHDKLDIIFNRIARREIDLEEIIRDYVIPSEGQYMWMYGNIANFKLNGNSDGSYTCNVKIVGPSEAAWAYSTSNTIVPPLNREKKVCGANSNSVESYFKYTVDGLNLKTLLEGVVNNLDKDNNLTSEGILPEWAGHVIKIENGNKIDGASEEKDEEAEDPNISQASFGDSTHAYYMTWKFFVNVVLNDERYGVKALFKSAGFTQDELNRVKILRPYKLDGVNDNPQLIARTPYIKDPFENFVGNHPRLRSIDPSTLIIVNERAVQLAITDDERQPPGLPSGNDGPLHQTTTTSERFINEYTGRADFHESGKSVALSSILGQYEEVYGSNSEQYRIAEENLTTGIVQDRLEDSYEDRGFLSSGVWLNHKAVVTAMLSSDTIIGGIMVLLNRMNYATRGYWKLTIDESPGIPSDPSGGTGEVDYASQGFHYAVVDANFKESSDDAVKELLSGGESQLHVFNRYIRTENEIEFGSDVIDCSVDMTLPKLLFSQIATLGLAQPKDIETAKSLGDPSVGELDEEVESPQYPGADQMLREMFAVTSVGYNSEGVSPDLTVLSKAEREQIVNETQCSGNATVITANTAGQGSAITNANQTAIPRSFSLFSGGPGARSAEIGQALANELVSGPEPTIEENTEQLNLANQRLAECQRRCVPAPTPTIVPIGITNPNRTNYVERVQYKQRLTELTVGEIISAQSVRAMFAVGKYQAIPNTFREWVTLKGISRNAVFTPELQETLGTYLISEKRPLVGRYVRGEGVSVNEAQTALAQEFASLPLPGPRYSKRGYYDGDSAGNNALTTSGELQDVLIEARRRRDLQYLKDFLAQFEGNYQSINIIPFVGARFITPRIGEKDYLRAINGFKYSREGQFPPSTNEVPATELPSPPPPSTPTVYVPRPEDVDNQEIINLCNECRNLSNTISSLQRQVNAQQREIDINGAKDRVLRTFGQLEAILKYIEPFPDLMVAQITRDGDGNKANAFGAAPGSLSITADITLPGINGLRVGQLFWIDRVPLFYRAFGAFQILSIDHTIGMDGWVTKIHSRFNFLGKRWRQSIGRILTQQGIRV